EEEAKRKAAEAEAATSAASPTDAKARARAAEAALKAIPRSGQLDLALCQKALNAAQAAEKIEFRIASATIHRVSANILDRIGAFLQRCPNTKVEIGGHT